MHLTIARALNSFGLAVMLGCLIIVGAATYSLQQLRVGGAAYAGLIAGKDLVADVLPPPLYVIEAYLNAIMIADETLTLDEARARFTQLRKDFEERRAFWAASALPAALKSELAGASAAAETFWKVLDGVYLPAVARRDRGAIQSAGAELFVVYIKHRMAVDALVTGANQFLADAEAAAHRASNLWLAVLLGTAVFVLAAIVVGVMGVRRRVIHPLRRMTAYMSRLAKGGYDQDAPVATRKDEIGEMAEAVAIFRQSGLERQEATQREEQLRAAAEAERRRVDARENEVNEKRRQVIETLAAGLDHIARGNLAFRLDQPLAPEYEKLRADFNTAIASLSGTLKAISAATTSVHADASGISSAADDLARRTEQQAAALEETSATLNGIVEAVHKTSNMSEQARAAVTAARREADGSAIVVRDAIAAMDTIEKSSREIGDIIVMIDEIAFQTNLLALNAGVEAARAGEAGRGFAIVAQEVRGLAQRSTEAAKAIKRLISTSNGQIESGVGLVRNTGEAFSSIGGQVARVTQLVEAIARSAQDQAASLREVHVAIGQMDRNTQQNAAMVDQTTNASYALASKAQDLGEMVARFKLEPARMSVAARREAEPANAPGQRLAAAFGR